jgi:hypothetical protein
VDFRLCGLELGPSPEILAQQCDWEIENLVGLTGKKKGDLDEGHLSVANGGSNKMVTLPSVTQPPSEQVFDFSGGAERDRTADLLNAIQALSQAELQPHALKL